MELNEFIQNASDRPLQDRINFKELDEWSSLIALSIIAMVDDEYDVTLKGDDIKNAVTIEDLFKTVESKA